MNARVRKAGLIAICLMLAGGGLAMAQGRGPGDGPGPHGRMGRGLGPMAGALHRLDLTDEQRDQVRATVHENMSGRLGELMREAGQARRELEQLIADPAADESQILDAAHQASLAGERLALERHRLTVAVAEILTDEQLQQLQELIAQAPRRGPRMRGRPGPAWDE